MKELHVDDVSCAVQDNQKLRACVVAISLPAHKYNRYASRELKRGKAKQYTDKILYSCLQGRRQQYSADPESAGVQLCGSGILTSLSTSTEKLSQDSELDQNVHTTGAKEHRNTMPNKM